MASEPISESDLKHLEALRALLEVAVDQLYLEDLVEQVSSDHNLSKKSLIAAARWLADKTSTDPVFDEDSFEAEEEEDDDFEDDDFEDE